MQIYPAVAAVAGDIDFDPDALHRTYLGMFERLLPAA